MPHRIKSLTDLEALYSSPLATTLKKETPFINDQYKRLIEASPFLAIASVGPEGLDCSPRGDGPGFVQIIDDRTIAIPDRRGNNRLDTLRNIIRDARVALLFMIPGWNETLRINGRAYLSTKPDLRARFAVNGSEPVTVIIVEVDAVYFQCARALKRSKLWNNDARIDPNTLPKAGELIQSVIADFDAKEYDAALQDRQNKSLY